MPQYVQVQHKDIFVSDNGRVINRLKQPLEHETGKDGRHMIRWQGETFYVDELVLTNFGEPPKRGRPPKEGEEPKYKDGDKSNLSADNLKWGKKKGASALPDSLRNELIDMVIQGETYKSIKDAFKRKYDLSLSDYRINETKKKVLKGED